MANPNRHLERWASRLSPADAERFWIVVEALRRRFAERDYHSQETYSLSAEFERLQAKGRTAMRAKQAA